MVSHRRIFVTGVFLCALVGLVPCADAQTLPAPPSTLVDTTYPINSGMTIPVAAGGNLQAALDSAQPGDTITLAAGATFSGSFTLHTKSGTGWIIVRTSAPDSSLPPPGTRIAPSYASVMPKIVANSSAPALQTSAGVHHWRFVGIEFTVAANLGTTNYGLVALGDGSSAQNMLSQVPYSLVLDRVYVHGLAAANVRRGVALNCASCATIDSYLSEIHEVNADSQAVIGWNGPGPFKIANNYLEAAGENILFGGADPLILNLVPSDIEIRGNFCSKQVAWRGSTWQIKNILEVKNAQRVLIDGNVFEHNWPAAQNGFSILFTVRNQDGTAVWSVVQDVTFTHNIVRHVAAGVNILGTDDIQVSQPTKRILIKDNLFDDVNATNWGTPGTLFQILNGTTDVTIDHNTAFHTGVVVSADGPPNSGFTYQNNLTPHNTYGVGGTGTFGNPILTLTTYFPLAVFRKNVLVGGDSTKYPADNFFPATMALVGFTDLAGGNYKLALTSPYKNAGSDGKDIGADIDALNAATANAILPPPATIVAAASDTTHVGISWTAVGNALNYEIARTANGTTYSTIGSTGGLNFTDNAASAGTAYLYRVRGLDPSNNTGAYSAPDLATTVIFADDPLVATVTVIKPVHVTDLRAAVNAVRLLSGLGAGSYADPTITVGLTMVMASHVTDLRSNLDIARSRLGLPAIVYTDGTITAGSTAVKAVHFTELRNGVK
jgi:hypothetical protein